MANIQERVNAEMENILRVLKELEKVKNIPNKKLVVLVGIGAYLQNIYTGIENILKQLLIHENKSIPETPTWHKDLLNLSIKCKIITIETANEIGKYLVFRHFFTHSYGFLIDEEKLNPLMNDISNVFSKFKTEINDYLSKING
ncbi:MAG: hypothetical protein ACTSPD_18105 [Promethearchaeota archaeon]